MQPLYTYVKGNMLWREGVAIPRPVEDAGQLMGFKRGYTETLKLARNEARRTARRHALGNTFYAPSIVLMITLLVHTAPA